ncbi:RNA polymerase sigma factor [Chitinophaga vietnamensis]|uniref:RNA polymerase sigma factor n=1 Tax=Chitinophaga vietnamensis TaxID=2593957 RepID=UPI0013756DD2|nr:RNA polymerase sigma factor [Chitinophaga vietnamensis]
MGGNKFHIDKTKLIRISEGDETAFREFFYEVLPWLTPYVGSMVKSPEATQEVIQETFIRIWVSRDKLPALQEPPAWIIKVATNECYTWFHKQASLRRLAPEEQAPAYTGSGEEQLQMKETLALIREAVNHMPPQRKKIYQLSRDQGLKTQEIADQLHCSHSYVKNTLSAALAHIRDYLKAAGKVLPLLIFLLRIK